MSEKHAARWTAVGLTETEYSLVLDRLGREPNDVELQLYGVMWSEHCSYKHSRPVLATLPTQGPRVLQGPGENAGVLDLGDGLAVAFKLESHNHPSAVEPYQGAATGVGGIIRDVFTMGARPVAMLDSLRFGELAGPGAARNAYLLANVVGGIAGYGNSIGIPTVGGEIYFEPAYQGNPLVNAMCVGILDPAKIQRGVAKGPGNPVLVIGARTGRDGIHGASLLASQSFDEQAEEKRPSVQVGDPFHEKLLLEACLELFETGAIVAMQDMGAAGLISSSSEVAARGGVGLDIDVARVPRRETGMAAWEVLLSESQERMLAVVQAGREPDVLQVVRRWGLQAEVIGRVTEGHDLVVREGDEVVAQVPVESLTDAPVYRATGRRPADLAARQSLDPALLPEPTDLSETLLRLLASPNLASRAWVYRQYDHMVRTNTIIYPGSDAAVLRLKGTQKALALATDGNGRYCYLDPRLGAALAVAEAARNVVCAGGEPIGITNCLNFGDPDQPEVFWTFQEAVAGMAEACVVLETPVTGGNVSFYNQTGSEAIYPTPVIGMVGLLQDAVRRATLGLKQAGDLLVLIGPLAGLEVPGRQQGEGDPLGVGGSEYLKVVHGKVAGRPPVLSLSLERAVQQAVLRANSEGLIRAAHDCADGGLAVALAEMWLAAEAGPAGPGNEPPAADERGVAVDLAGEAAGPGLRAATALRPDFLLFGETASRVLLEIPPESLPHLEAICRGLGTPLRILGKVTAEPRLRISLGAQELVSVSREAAAKPWKEALACAISQ
ncbi:MAG: phosphoribosylformylglycinamidine synthase subunit PurL [Symbiobacteriia bacterium]